MAVYKLQIATAADSTRALDRIVNTFHLNDIGISNDPEGLVQDAVELFSTVWYHSREVNGKIYDAEGSPPHFPLGEHTVQLGASPASQGPREVALCLSYFGERNLPRTRGRMFLGVFCAGWGAADARPNGAIRTLACDLGQGIADLGGADVSWVTFSSIDGHHEQVTQCYCDDEWDTVRSRGLIPTDRTVRVTGS